MTGLNPIVYSCSKNENYDKLYKVIFVVTFLIGYQTNTSINVLLRFILQN